MSAPPDSGRCAGAVSAGGGAPAEFRVLRRLAPIPPFRGRSRGEGVMVGCAIDVETTGLDHDRDVIVELAFQRFVASAEGRILGVFPSQTWLEDPGRPIPPEVSELTGILDADVSGRRMVDPLVAGPIADADFVVAHNAGFDRPFVEARLPFCAGRPWVCSMRDVDWRSHGFEGRVLGHLMMQAGWFFDAHRAATDVAALLRLLDHELPIGRSVLAVALEAARSDGWLFEAAGAPFAAKDALRRRGYRWAADCRLWWREVGAEDFDREMEWAVVEVYAGRRRPRTSAVTWRERYARRTTA